MDQPTSAVVAFYWSFTLRTGKSRTGQAVIGTYSRTTSSTVSPSSTFFSHVQPVGRCESACGQSVGGRFLQCRVTVSVAAAQVRLKAITAQTSHAAVAVNRLDGRGARAEFFRLACTCSMIVRRRWVMTAATVSRSTGSVVVKNAWNRYRWSISRR